MTEFFDNTSLEDIFPDYTPDSPVTAGIDFRGLQTILRYPANSATLIFSVPGRNFEVTFDADSRDQAQELFEAWLKGDFESPDASGKSLTRLLQILVAESPVDPVAGNPNSLQTRMFNADFEAGITGPFISQSGSLDKFQNLFSIGGEYAYFDAGPYDGSVINVPLNYKVNFKSRPKLSLIFDLPITITFTNNEADSYIGSFAIGFQYRPFKWWSLTPMGRIGGAGSFDIGALSFFYSGSLVNYLNWSTDNFRIGLGTMGGIASSIDGIQIGGWDLSYDLTNYVYLKMELM